MLRGGRPEKFRPERDSNRDLCDVSAPSVKLCDELVIMCVDYKPVDDGYRSLENDVEQGTGITEVRVRSPFRPSSSLKK